MIPAVGRYRPSGPSSTLLLHFDTASIVDSSSNNIPITVGGTAVTSAVQVKFGARSLFLDGTFGCCLSTTDSRLNLGTSDFTIDLWFYQTDNTGQQFLLDTRTGPSQYSGISLYLNGGGVFWYDGAISYGGTAYVTNVWNHLELCRSGTTTYFFLNGVLIATNTGLGGNFNTAQYVFGAAQYTPPGVNSFAGYIDEFHVINGIALNTSSFTPPTGPYTS